MAGPLSLSWLRALAVIAQSGGFGVVRAFGGMGRTPEGRGVCFKWKKNGRLVIRSVCGVQMPGVIRFRGTMEFETVNRLRNFPVFHFRDEAYWLKLPASEKKGHGT